MAKTISDAADLGAMRAALGLARRGLGSVWPNPAVGCVIVSPDGAGTGRVVGRGWTQPGGRPHAETEALTRAGAAARGATAYVTLEPCSHHGQTPPCADALVAAGIRRAVIALEDPDPRVSGRGLARLRDGGVEVRVGVGADEAAEINAGFFLAVRDKRPLITLKMATTLDGRIATASGESRWITGESARDLAHTLRANHDAVMIGIGTAVADDPALTCRLPGMEQRQPVRIVIDTRLRLPLTSQLVATARRQPTWIITTGADPIRSRAFAEAGCEMIEAPTDVAGLPELTWIVAELARRKLTRVLVEGGSRLAAAVLRADLADRVVWFHAPSVIGSDGMPAAAAFGITDLKSSPRFARLDVTTIGDDIVETYRRVG